MGLFRREIKVLNLKRLLLGFILSPQIALLALSLPVILPSISDVKMFYTILYFNLFASIIAYPAAIFIYYPILLILQRFNMLGIAAITLAGIITGEVVMGLIWSLFLGFDYHFLVTVTPFGALSGLVSGIFFYYVGLKEAVIP